MRFFSVWCQRSIDATLSEPLQVHGVGDRGNRVESMLEAVGLDALAVMRRGRIVETADVAQLKTGRLNDPYSRELYVASGAASRRSAGGERGLASGHALRSSQAAERPVA